MIIRAVLLAMIFAAAVYGLLWLISCTPFFKDRERVRHLLKVGTLIFISGIASVFLVATVMAVDHII